MKIFNTLTQAYNYFTNCLICNKKMHIDRVSTRYTARKNDGLEIDKVQAKKNKDYTINRLDLKIRKYGIGHTPLNVGPYYISLNNDLTFSPVEIGSIYTLDSLIKSSIGSVVNLHFRCTHDHMSYNALGKIENGSITELTLTREYVYFVGHIIENNNTNLVSTLFIPNSSYNVSNIPLLDLKKLDIPNKEKFLKKINRIKLLS